MFPVLSFKKSVRKFLIEEKNIFPKESEKYPMGTVFIMFVLHDPVIFRQRNTYFSNILCKLNNFRYGISKLQTAVHFSYKHVVYVTFSQP